MIYEVFVALDELNDSGAAQLIRALGALFFKNEKYEISDPTAEILYKMFRAQVIEARKNAERISKQNSKKGKSKGNSKNLSDDENPFAEYLPKNSN